MAEADENHHEDVPGTALTVVGGERPADRPDDHSEAADDGPPQEQHFDPYSRDNIEGVRGQVAHISPEQRATLRTDAERLGWDILSQVQVNGRTMGPELVVGMRSEIHAAAQELITILKDGEIDVTSPEVDAFALRARQVKANELIGGNLPDIEPLDEQASQDESVASSHQQAVDLRGTQQQKLAGMLAMDGKSFDAAIKAWDAHRRVQFVEGYDAMRDEANSMHAELKAKEKQESDELNAKYEGLLEVIGGGPVSWSQLEAVLRGGPNGKSIDEWYAEQKASPDNVAKQERIAKLLGDEEGSEAAALVDRTVTNKYVSEKLMPLLAEANGAGGSVDAQTYRHYMTRLATEPELRADLGRREALIGTRTAKPEPQAAPEAAPAPATAESAKGFRNSKFGKWLRGPDRK